MKSNVISDIVGLCKEIIGGEDGWVWAFVKNTDRSKRAFVADELIKLTQRKTINWASSESGKVAVCHVDEWTIVVTRFEMRGGCKIGGTVGFYELNFFENNQEVLSLDGRCDNGDYDDMSSRVPIMDVYDVATTGQGRRPPRAICSSSQNMHLAS